MLWAATICPDHHDHTRDNHRDGKNLPHADVLHPGTGKLRVGLAEKLNNDAKRAVANQEQARDSSHWARFTNIQVEDNKQHHTFQQQLVKL